MWVDEIMNAVLQDRAQIWTHTQTHTHINVHTHTRTHTYIHTHAHTLLQDRAKICSSVAKTQFTHLLWTIPLKMLHPWNPPNRKFQIHLYKFELNKTHSLNLYHGIPRNLSLSNWQIFRMQYFQWKLSYCINEIINEVLQERAQIYRNVICGIF